MIDVTADGRYQLFVNGVRVGRGPSRCNPAQQRYDRYDIASLLVPGENVFAALLHVYGVDMAWYETARAPWQTVFGDGAFWLDATIDCPGIRTDILSDELWRWLECPAWRRDAPRAGWGQDFIEQFDASLMPDGWEQPGFDDSVWPAAQTLRTRPGEEDRAKGFGAIEPFPTLVPRGHPQPVETVRLPQAILGIYGVVPDATLPLDRRLYTESLAPVPDEAVTGADGLLAEGSGGAVVRTRPGMDVAILLDFGERHNGYPGIELEAIGGEIVEVAAAETFDGQYGGEAVPRLVRATFMDCAHMFSYTARPGGQRFEKFEWVATRFVQIVVRNAPAGVRIRAVYSRETRHPLDRKGAFACSDPFLNDLWTAGRLTAELNCTDGWTDGPAREKRQWVGDGYVQLHTLLAAHGPSSFPSAREFLTQTAEAQRPDGLLPMFAPGDNKRDGIVIPDFSLHWIRTLRAYSDASVDTDTLERLFPYALKVLGWFERHAGANGLIADLPDWHFIEWADIDRRGASLPVNGLYIGALDAAAEILSKLGATGLAAKLAARADAVATAINAGFWNGARGLFVDSIDPATGAQRPRASQHGNAAALLFARVDPLRVEQVIAAITDPTRLRRTATPPVVRHAEPFDEACNIVRANTFFMTFVNEALARFGGVDLALDGVRALYGPMISAGSETLWESNEPGASLCHAFSASPVYLLSRYILGIWPVAPGSGRLHIEPHFSTLAWCKGVMPTAAGDVGVSWTREGRTARYDCLLPPGSTAAVAPPRGWMLTSESELGSGHSIVTFKERR